MSTARRTRAPKGVESFGPEIFEALIEGSKREIILELPYKKAVAFRQRMNSLRAAMRESGHEKSKIVAQTTIRILWGKDAGYDNDTAEKRSSQNVRAPISKMTPSKLVISPADSEFSEALRKAGVTIKPLGTDAPATVPVDAPARDIGSDILQRFLAGEDNATDK